MSIPLLPSWLCLLAVTLATLPCVSATQYSLAKEYYGSSFFEGWTFYNYCTSILVALLKLAYNRAQMIT